MAYSLDCVISYVTRQAAEDLVVIMVGDHQPAPVVTGPDAGRDVPITVITGDQTVLTGSAAGAGPPVSDRRPTPRSGGWTPSAIGS